MFIVWVLWNIQNENRSREAQWGFPTCGYWGKTGKDVSRIFVKQKIGLAAKKISKCIQRYLNIQKIFKWQIETKYLNFEKLSKKLTLEGTEKHISKAIVELLFPVQQVRSLDGTTPS